MNSNRHDKLSEIGLLIDQGTDELNEPKLREALALLDQIKLGSLGKEELGELHYFYGNTWWALWQKHTHNDPKLAWDWNTEEVQTAVFHYRSSLASPANSDTGRFRRYQTLTNLGNALDTLGRFVEAQPYWALAHQYSAAAQQLKQPAGMAVASRAVGLVQYGGVLYDRGHTSILQHTAYQLFKKAQSLGLEKDANKQVSNQTAELKQFYGPAYLESVIDLDSDRLGETEAERSYRRWCLKECLFLSPLNDIGPHPIAAKDIFHLPTMVTPLDTGTEYHGLFNQLKQEYIAARTLFYEGQQSAGAVQFSDMDTFLYDTMDYPRYGLAIEKQRQSFRMAYSVLDKVAFFINEYYGIGQKRNNVYLRKVWFDPQDAGKSRLSSVIDGVKNWPLRGLYFLSKDLYERGTAIRDVLEPEAKGLSDVRNSLEHRYLKIHDEIQPTLANPRNGSSLMRDNLAHSVSVIEFRAKSLHLLRLVRASLIYLSLSINQEERRKQSTEQVPTAPIVLKHWDPESQME